MTARPDGTVRTARTIDLPRSIVWDALVDPVLVEGWLDPRLTLLDGVVHERVESETLDTESPGLGRLRFALDEVPGGTRETSCAIEVVVLARPASDATVDWELRLDRLEDLLRGHPVDWARAATDLPDATRSAR